MRKTNPSRLQLGSVSSKMPNMGVSKRMWAFESVETYNST